MELRALSAIRSLEHEHLTPAVAAFQRGGSYYLVFEWADGLSLQYHWKKIGKPKLSAELIKCVLVQLRGLADALSKIHGSGREEPQTSKSGNWRHGDIKPDNILRFNCGPQGMELGTLRIADLGLAKYHTEATKDRQMPTEMRYGTVNYEGPEAHGYVAKLNPRSRRYDVWSMGCVTLEFIIWLLHGYEGLENFRNEPLSNPKTETNFYKVDISGHMEVGRVAKHWMKCMRKNPELKERGESALRDLLDLVEERLLVVEIDGTAAGTETSNKASTGKRAYRATAEDLVKALQRIIRDGNTRQNYFFTGIDRTNVAIPRAKLATGTHLQTPVGGQPAYYDSPQADDEVHEIRVNVPDQNVILHFLSHPNHTF